MASGSRSRLGARRAVATALAGGTLALALGACEAPVDVRGHLPDPETMAQIKPGEDGRSDVIDLLGSPSARSSFRDRTWYYIGSKEQQFAFFDAEVLKRNVFAVTFNEGDTVESTRLYTKADGRAVNPVDRITPTPGRDLTILQQLLGNLGRFNTEGGGNPATGGGPGSPSPFP